MTINLALQRPTYLTDKTTTKKVTKEEAKEQKLYTEWLESQSPEVLENIKALAVTNAQRTDSGKPITKPKLEGPALTYYKQQYDNVEA